MTEAARRNKASAAPPSPAAVADYDALAGRLPERSEAVAHFIDAAVAAFQEYPPEGVHCVIAYTPVSWKRKPAEVELLAFARENGEDPPIINGAVPALADIMRQSEIIPMLSPVTPVVWAQAVEKKAIGYRQASHRGILVYDAERSQEEKPMPI